MGVTYGDHLIDSGYYDITPEQEREAEAREICAQRGIDPDEICADGWVTAWMIVAQEPSEVCSCRHRGDCDGSCAHPEVSEKSIQTLEGGREMINNAPHGWLEANCRMRPDGIWFDTDGNFYRPATEDDAQYGHNDTWPGDPIPVAQPKPDNELLDQAVAFAEMWGTEQNWQHVRDAYVEAIMRARAALKAR